MYFDVRVHCGYFGRDDSSRAWKQDDVGLFHDFEVPLEQLEYQIIGLASDLYPVWLLNSEGA